MPQASQQYAIRITCLAIALAVGGIGWLAWRYLDNARELPWVLWAVAGVGAMFALVAPVRWLRAALHMNLLTQDLFRR